MGKKLYVGNLPYNVSDDQLREIFAGYGEVASATIITDAYSQRSKGFGFVEMENDEDALKAKDELNGSLVGERKIVVDEARPRRDSRNDSFQR